MEEIKKTVAENLTALRKEHHYTQLQLAELLHYSDKAVSKWERGESLPDLVVLKQIADLYHVTLDDLVTNAEERRQRAEAAAAASVQRAQTADPESEDAASGKPRLRTRVIVTALSGLLVWLIATIAFVTLDIFAPDVVISPYMFLYALPLTTIVILVFNSIWFNRRTNYVIISVLMWLVLLTIYLSFLKYNIWKIFWIGIPAQVIIFLWSRLKPSRPKAPVSTNHADMS